MKKTARLTVATFLISAAMPLLAPLGHGATTALTPPALTCSGPVFHSQPGFAPKCRVADSEARALIASFPEVGSSPIVPFNHIVWQGGRVGELVANPDQAYQPIKVWSERFWKIAAAYQTDGLATERLFEVSRLNSGWVLLDIRFPLDERAADDVYLDAVLRSLREVPANPDRANTQNVDLRDLPEILGQIPGGAAFGFFSTGTPDKDAQLDFWLAVPGSPSNIISSF